jgi:hypothetical protein
MEKMLKILFDYYMLPTQEADSNDTKTVRTVLVSCEASSTLFNMKG